MAYDISGITAGQNILARQPTPDQRFGNFLSNQSAMQTNQIQQQNFLAQKAVGNALQQATDPNTGQLDTGKASVLISQDPNAAPAAQDAIRSIYDNKLQQMNLTSQQQQQMGTTTGIFANSLRALTAAKQAAAAKSGNPADAQVTQGDVISSVADIYNRGGFGDPKSSQAQQGLKGLIQGMPTDPAQLTQYVQTHAVDMGNWHDAIQQAITGVPGSTNTGSGLQGITQNPNTGAITPRGGQIANQLSPQDLSQPVDIKDPVTGQPKTMTRGALLQMQGVTPVPAGGAAPFPAALQGPGAGSYRPPGSMPSAGGQPQPAQAPAGAPAPGAPSPFGGAVATAPAPIPFGLQGKAADSSSDQFLADQKEAASYPQRANAANHVLDLLAALPSNATGPGTAGFTAIKSGINSWLGGVGLTPFNPATITNTEQLHKNLEMQAESMPGAGRSADALASAQAANPNINMQTATIRDATASLLALQKMKQTLLTEYQQKFPSDTGGGGYQAWMTKRASEVDPRAWAVDTMTPAAKAALGKSLQGNKPAMAKFQASLAQADASGLLSSGGGP